MHAVLNIMSAPPRPVPGATIAEDEESISSEPIPMSCTASRWSPATSDLGTTTLSHPEPVHYVVHTNHHTKKALVDDDDEPLVDTTAALTLRSKKTERMQKRRERKSKNAKVRTEIISFLDLPAELLHEVLGHLRPRDILRLQQTNRTLSEFISEQEITIAKDVIRQRYWVLTRCLPLPVFLHDVDRSAHTALLSDKRQAMVNHHRKPYQHVRHIDETRVCTCMSCVLAWNILCMVLDLSHWQRSFESREPIPMIPRGTRPEWNENLLSKHALTVYKAMRRPLAYAAVLEKHLATTTLTIIRRSKWTKRPVTSASRLYRLSLAEAEAETDEYLERSGPPSHEFPFHRDNYYNLDAYVPNRIWSKDEQRWKYYASGLHERDVEWVKARFMPAPLVDREVEERDARTKGWYSPAFSLPGRVAMGTQAYPAALECGPNSIP